MNKKLILIAAAAGAVSFAGAFATGWLSRPTAAMGEDTSGQTKTAGQTSPPASGAPSTLTATLTSMDASASARTLTEQQLEQLIREIREKMEEYDRKLREVGQEKERLQIAQQTLKTDIGALNNLRTELSTSIADLKNERDMLLKTRIEVEQVEKANLMAIAAAYDKMDAISASGILTSMAAGSSKNAGGRNPAANMNDAVKILFFMQERTKAKVLAELAGQEPALAALLCQRLKQVQEGK